MSGKDLDKDPEENNDVVAGVFDETNGVAMGLDGESDGTVNGEDFSAGDPEGKHRGFGYALTHWGDREKRRAP